MADHDEDWSALQEGEEAAEHYGTPRHSGRYPWGSGENPYQRSENFYKFVKSQLDKGISKKDIAKSISDGPNKHMSIRKMNALYSNAGADIRRRNVQRATRLRDKGWGYSAIGRAMGLSDNTVRSLLNEEVQNRKDRSLSTANLIETRVKESGGFIEVGKGSEARLQISSTKMANAINQLEARGYPVFQLRVPQGNTHNKTVVTVVGPKGSTYKDAYNALDKIETIDKGYYTEDGGETFQKVEPPKSIDSKRIYINYTSDDHKRGGVEKDGVIELRRGVDDISLKDAHYAQVRILVDGDKYMKGMALYSDNIPDGYDIVYNTNKTKAESDKVFKKIKDDPDNPFGATIRTDDESSEPELILCQRHYTDKDGNRQLSVLNIVNEEGNWQQWGRTLSSQMLSKQGPALAQRQLDISFERRKEDFEEIKALTNKAVEYDQLIQFADSCDSAAVNLKAAAIPGSASHVILPFPGMKENEIYAPNYENGSRVACIRYPHGGIFEIAELTVNNNVPEAKSILGQAKDAVGIHPSVAAKLSGADFDGDTVTVIPNDTGDIRSRPALDQLKGYEPKVLYRRPDDSIVKTGKPTSREDREKAKRGEVIYDGFDTQAEMGKVSNLITDMTIKDAPTAEIARAVRHSMTVIDAEKHNLDWKTSYEDNGIAELKRTYQGVSEKNGALKGASTLISQAKSRVYVYDRKEGQWDPVTKRRIYIDPKTGEKLWEETGATRMLYKRDPDTGIKVPTGKIVRVTNRSTKMAEEKDAHKLSSGYLIEEVYANHANRLKALANEARKTAISLGDPEYSPSAAKTYAKEVEDINIKYLTATANKPVQRIAQAYSDHLFKLIERENPDMSDDDRKKAKTRCDNRARKEKGVQKASIKFTDREWEAIQAGAFRPSRLKAILREADKDNVKQHALPKSWNGLSPAKRARARAMLSRPNATQYEVAQALGVSVTTLMNALNLPKA